MLVVPASPQSGRKTPTPKPALAPSLLPPEPDQADKSETKNPSKPAPRLFVDGERIYRNSEADKRPIVSKKPTPGYPREARSSGVQGTVIIRCIFSAKGKVTNIRVVSGRPLGLTERSIAAAEKIQFKPPSKDGKPVSVWMERQYTFHVR
ncbi:MAG: TonB family protein [Acidobacteriota bacterium]